MLKRKNRHSLLRKTRKLKRTRVAKVSKTRFKKKEAAVKAASFLCSFFNPDRA